MMRPISVIIPALNEERYLPTLLASLLACDHELEIIVVDGQSEDGTLQVVEQFVGQAPRHITIRAIASTVKNVSHQRNLGVKHSSHDTLIFLDADTAVPAPTHLRQLLEHFHAGQLAAASCRFLPLEPDWRARAYFAFLYRFHRLMARLNNPYALGACLITRRDIFDRIGGFDATIRINEDAEYCLRASKHGDFRILPVALQTSTRRFRKHGYLRMGLRYLRIFLSRTFRGEARHDRIPYEFGNYK